MKAFLVNEVGASSNLDREKPFFNNLSTKKQQVYFLFCSLEKNTKCYFFLFLQGTCGNAKQCIRCSDSVCINQY